MHGYGVPRLAEVEHLSAVGRLHSCQNRGYGGLAGSVFPDQPQNLSAPHGNIHAAQCHHGTEYLDHIPHFHQYFVGGAVYLLLAHGKTPCFVTALSLSAV